MTEGRQYYVIKFTDGVYLGGFERIPRLQPLWTREKVCLFTSVADARKVKLCFWDNKTMRQAVIVPYDGPLDAGFIPVTIPNRRA